MMKRRVADALLSAFAASLCWMASALPLHAADFLAGGICYDITATGQVTVVANDNPYSGYVSIPSTVTASW